ncbi:ABC transporter permease [Gordonia spumicola]|uniref:ABC transporter permease n=1 Tax=Gordonia spumicola TaxID=589161 RepID=A0A7I9VEU6_9ACTN|nr:iron chelate uptake ABC transporter family permease subunit [Gordonia spumicola]GEE03844.1 ABC transporter permease [Gordonia spumicola]
MAVGVLAGSADIGFGDVLRAVAGQVGIGSGVDASTAYIVVDLRLPRVVEGAVIGAGLALCGSVLQSLTGNVLADPYILGLASGASVGATAVITLGVSVAGLAGTASVTAAAFLGAVVALLLVFAIATTRSGALLPSRLILAGVAVAQAGSALSAILILRADVGAADRVMRWTLGSLAGARWSTMPVILVVVGVVAVGVLASSRTLDAFAFGERSAMSLGVNVAATRWALYGTVSICTAVMVAHSGIIGFVGLVVPHAARMIVGPMHARLLPIVVLAGALLLVWSDVIARTVVDQQELPVGLVTAVIGVPAFVWLLRRRGGDT